MEKNRMTEGNRRRGRPRKVEPLKTVIAKIWDKHPDWSDKQIQDQLRCYLRGQAKTHWSESQIEAFVIDHLPGPESIGDFRRNELEPNAKKLKAERDIYWNNARASEYDIGAEAIAQIMMVLRRAINEHQRVGIPLRQAVWISRLYAIPWLRDNPKSLDMVSAAYTIYEEFSLMAGIPFNSGEFDEMLLEPNGIQWFKDRLAFAFGMSEMTKDGEQ